MTSADLTCHHDAPTSTDHRLPIPPRRAFGRLRSERADLVTTSYVLVETYALLARRVGMDAVSALREDLQPLFDVVWVDGRLHERALDTWLSSGRAALSLVDSVSLIVAAEQQVDAVFAFDRHFSRAGFQMTE